MIAIFGALDEEIKDLRKGITRLSPDANGCIVAGKLGRVDCVLALTGVGKEAAERTASYVIENYRIDTVVSVGFGGSLNRDIRSGDVVVCSSISSDCNGRGELFSDPRLVSAIKNTFRSNALKHLIGKGVTISEICATPEEKYTLGREFSACIADMESYWIGRIASERGLPFLVVRTIFDTAQDDLSFFDRITNSGRVEPKKVLKYLLSRPDRLYSIAGYSWKANRARRNLSIFVKNLVVALESRMPSGGGEPLT